MQEIISLLPKVARNYVKAETPVPMKMMAASGALPLPPQHLGLALVCLAHDPDYNVAQKAVTTFHDQPPQILRHLLNNNKLPPAVMNFIAQQLQHKSEYTQQIILHRQTPHETLSWLAGRVEGENLLLIAQNQKRQHEYPLLIQKLLGNEKLPNEHRVRITEFALREGLDTGLNIEQIRAYVHDDLLRELGIEIPEEEPEEVPKEEPEEELEEFILEYDIEMLDDGPATQEELPAVTEDFEQSEQLQEAGEKTPQDELPAVEEEEKKKLTFEQEIFAMNVTQKIKAAISGNKQVRGMLITNANRLISGAVLKNPRITEGEVVKIAASRSVSEDIIRGITRNREWMKLYQVKVNLVNNPKCPQGISMRLLSHIRINDLKGLIRNKNIPGLIATNAKKMMKQKENKK